jgi:iron complex outermembrane recepter protein
LPGLELNGAYRYDHYSDYGHSSTPKFGVKWSPIDAIALRGTYSEAFRAPGPTESGESSSLGFTNIAIITIGDPNVKPETAKSYTVGFVVEPTSSTNLSLDYFKIDRENEITPADQASIVGGAPLSIDPGEPVRVAGALPNSFLYYDEFGDLQTISGPYSNLAETTTDGLDFDLRQKFDLGDVGSLDVALLWTRVFNFEKTGADGTELEYVGTHGPYALSSAGGTPRDRGSLELSWSQQALAVTARVNYVSSMKMIDHRGEELVDGHDGTFFTTTGEGAYFNVDPNGIVCGVYNPDGSAPNGCKVDSFTTVDLYGVFRGSENWQVDLSVTNLFNKVAPFDPYTYGGRNYNPAFHQAGAVGRFFTAGFKYTF